jgi:peroxiredoxin
MVRGLRAGTAELGIRFCQGRCGMKRTAKSAGGFWDGFVNTLPSARGKNLGQTLQRGVHVLVNTLFTWRGNRGCGPLLGFFFDDDRSSVCRYVAGPGDSRHGGDTMRYTVMFAHLLLGLALLTTGCATFDLFKRPERTLAMTPPRTGTLAPEIDGEDFDGKRLKLSDHRGKVVVLVFWMTRCPPCMAMVPHEKSLLERHRSRPFALLGVNNDSDDDTARATIAAKKMNWPHWKTNGAAEPVNPHFGVSALPTIFVIDATGVIRYRFQGFVDGELDHAVETLLAEAEKKVAVK